MMNHEIKESTLLIGNLRQNNFIEKLMLNKFFWIFFLLISLVYPIVKSVRNPLPAAPEALLQLPRFEFKDQNNMPFGSSSLEGKAYIANFIFTTCPSICPELTKKMKRVQGRVHGLGDRVRLVSFTVDPENDSPTRLKKYGDEYGVNEKMWSLVTGDKAQLEQFLVQGFKVPVGSKEKQIAQGKVTTTPESTPVAVDVWDIAHSGKFVLVDPIGQIRGYYDTDDQSMGQMLIDLGLIVNEFHYKSKNVF